MRQVPIKGDSPDCERSLDIIETVAAAQYARAGTPLEIDQGAKTLGLSLERYLRLLKKRDWTHYLFDAVLDEDATILC